MQEAFFSQSWYRVAPLRPRLRSHVQIYRHTYRGNDWYIIQDKFTGRYHRFSPEAYYIIGLMNGHYSLADIWENACRRLGDHMPTQDEVIHLLARLFRLDLLQTSVLPDFDDLSDRHRQSARQRLLQRLKSPAFVRIPLLDPDRFLNATISFVSPLLCRTTFVLWLLLLTAALMLAGVHWADLTNSFTDHILGLENLLVISLIYPVLKVFHEFGHAYVVKKWGGEVHEMGILLLVFMPIPYMDASSSMAFREKHKRMLVGAAGIMVELGLASLALLVWLSVEPGLVRAICYNIMLIAGISTLLFNGNPLLKFDAYYVLADFLEIPNLAQRSTRFIGYVIQRYLLGITEVRSSADSKSEAVWLFVYGCLSFCYRIFISFRIILFIASKFFFVGVLLAAWIVMGMLVAPLVRVIHFVRRDKHMRAKRVRLFAVVIVPLCLGIGALLFTPLPFSTVCEGVVWAPEESRVVTDTEGFVAELVVSDGRHVEPGELLIRMEDPRLASEVRLLEARRMEYQSRYDASLQGRRTDTVLLKEVLGQLDAEIARAREREEALLVRSSGAGHFFMFNERDFPGRFAHRGATVGYVLTPETMSVLGVVEQDDIEKVRNDTTGVSVRMAEAVERVIPAEIVREVPAASKQLPSRALSLEGGGRVALDPRAPGDLIVHNRFFLFEVRLEELPALRVEERVFVRFSHSPRPLILRGYDAVRRLLLRRFAV